VKDEALAKEKRKKVTPYLRTRPVAEYRRKRAADERNITCRITGNGTP
jgi:hypothetical protein